MIKYSGIDWCYECGKNKALVHIGEEVDYDVRWLTLCRECLEKALAILDEEEK